MTVYGNKFEYIKVFVWFVGLDRKSPSFPFIFSSSSSCSVGWKQGRTPWGYQWSGNHSCCLNHQGSGGFLLHSCLTWAPRRHRCPAHHVRRHCLLHSLEAPFSHGPDSKEGKHLPLYLEMEAHITSGKPRREQSAVNIHHPGQTDGLELSLYSVSAWLGNMIVILISEAIFV